MTDKRFFKEIDHTADLQVEIYGNHIHELFRNAVKTLYALLDIDPLIDEVQEGPFTSQNIEIYGYDREDVIIRLMGECLYLAVEENKQILVDSVFLDGPLPEEGQYSLRIDGRCRPLTPAMLKGRKEIKAVTYHGVKIEQKTHGLVATIILDT